MKNKILSVALVSALTICSSRAESDGFGSGKWSVGMGISTLGVGADIAYKFNESFKVRGMVNYFQLSRKFNNDEVTLRAKMRLFTAGILGEWHLLRNGFRITGGLVYNGNRLNLKGTTSRSFTINGRTYAPRDIGEANGYLNFRPIAPYLGIGYDSGHEKKTGLSFKADAGLLFQGNVRGKIDRISGLLASRTQAVNDTKDEIVKKANKNRWLKTYPVISFGLNYKF